MRILIAEDDSILADGLLRSLRYDGYAVNVVADGSSADYALQLQSFDLLTSDPDSPVMSGLAILRQLRQRHTPLPFLILPASDTLNRCGGPGYERQRRAYPLCVHDAFLPI